MKIWCLFKFDIILNKSWIWSCIIICQQQYNRWNLVNIATSTTPIFICYWGCVSFLMCCCYCHGERSKKIAKSYVCLYQSSITFSKRKDFIYFSISFTFDNQTSNTTMIIMNQIDGSETENFIIHFQSTFMIIDVRKNW